MDLNRSQAAEAVFEFIKAHPYLLQQAITADALPFEAAAVDALLDLVEGRRASLVGLPALVASLASMLVMDFMGKLIAPDSPFQNSYWTIPDTAAPADQGAHVIAQSIRQAHPRPPVQH